MRALELLLDVGAAPRLLCLGAHSDDIEIGASATVLALAEKYPNAHIDWVVFSAASNRRQEALDSAEHCTAGFASANIQVLEYRDGHFPAQFEALKAEFERIKGFGEPDVIFSHYRDDLHQDHALIAQITWQTFRNHFILEYEIAKYEGDLGSPNVFSVVSEPLHERKLELLHRYFKSQQGKGWFSPEAFSALMRIRGIECQSASGYAEGFYARKLVLS